MRLKEGADAFLAGALKLGSLDSVLEDFEGGHALDFTGLRDVGGGVNVDLAKGPASVCRLVRDSLEDGADTLARRAPCSSEVDDHGLIGGGGLEDLEFGSVSNVLNLSHCVCVFLFWLGFKIIILELQLTFVRSQPSTLTWHLSPLSY